MRESQARAWVAHLNSGRVTTEDRVAHQQWYTDPANAKAWKSVNALWQRIGDIGPSTEEIEAEMSSLWRRRFMRRAVMASSAAMMVIAAGNWLYRPYPLEALMADAATGLGEHRQMVLADGSHVQLTGATVINMRLNGPRRDVDLLAGEAFFKVAHDVSRPFTVHAGTASVTVTGTMFTVSRFGDHITLKLAQGSVIAGEAGQASTLHIVPGQRVDWKAGRMTTSKVQTADIGSWRYGRLVFRSRPLDEVLQELSLYRPGRILTWGNIGSMPVTGVFDPASPDTFLPNLTQSLPLSVAQIGPITVIRRRQK